ncbi:MAG: hypothetical protein ACRC7N_15700, partial [Clostridium sp.]
VKNIGNDLSGTHTPITNKYNVEIYNEKLNLNIDITTNKFIIVNFKKFYNLNCIGYISLLLKKVGLYKFSRNFRNKIMMRIQK